VLGLAGALLLFDGVLLAIVLGAVHGSPLPFDDLALDDRAERARGRVLAVEPRGGGVHAVRYQFATPDGRTWTATSHAEQLVPEPGADVSVEYAAADPAVSRVHGTRRSVERPLARVLLGLVALPGGLLLLVWLREVVRTRNLLRDGALTTAKIVRVAPIRGVNPPHVRIDYELTDRGGARRAGVQRALARGPLARGLAGGAPAWPAVVDEVDPRAHRLVVAEDFVR
jgi:hypothetical protein